MRTNQAKQFKGDNVIADYSAKSVVVGIDGSQAAVAAAVWGAGEALHRDVVLKLLYVIDRNRAFTPGVVKAQHFVAEAALQDAHAAVEATQKPVKLELETVSGDPGTTLIEESRSAVLLCVGAPKALPHGPCDSLAANMAASAHCSVAVVPAAQYPAMTRTGWVAASELVDCRLRRPSAIHGRSAATRASPACGEDEPPQRDRSAG